MQSTSGDEIWLEVKMWVRFCYTVAKGEPRSGTQVVPVQHVATVFLWSPSDIYIYIIHYIYTLMHTVDGQKSCT